MLSLLLAQAAQATSDSPSGVAGLISSPLPLIAVMFAIFYFMIIRPQSKTAKTHQEFLGKLQKGDEVVTTGGIFGRIYTINDDKVLTLEVANNVRIRVLKAQIAGPVQQPSAEIKPAEDIAKK